jgi:hypothetical protein
MPRTSGRVATTAKQTIKLSACGPAHQDGEYDGTRSACVEFRADAGTVVAIVTDCADPDAEVRCHSLHELHHAIWTLAQAGVDIDLLSAG